MLILLFAFPLDVEAQVTACVNAWDSVGARMKGFGGKLDPLVCADYQDLFTDDARKECAYEQAKLSITTVEAKARQLLGDCRNSCPPDKFLMVCGGLWAEWQQAANLLSNVLAAGPWEGCIPDRCAVRLTKSFTTIPASGGSGSVGVTAKAADCSWSVKGGGEWVHVTSGTSGSGNGTVAFTVDANEHLGRYGGIAIGPRSFGIEQAGAPCRYTVDVSSISAPPGGSRGVINVTASEPQCIWMPTSTSVMVGVWDPHGMGGLMTGAAQMPYFIKPNYTTSVQSATLTITDQPIVGTTGPSQPIRITQSAASGAVLNALVVNTMAVDATNFKINSSVSNPSTKATSGTVSVAFELPPELTVRSISSLVPGKGWTCTQSTLTCTRSDTLAPKGTYSEGIEVAVTLTGKPDGDLVVRAKVSNGAADATTVIDHTLEFKPVIAAILPVFATRAPANPNLFAPGEAIPNPGQLPLPAIMA